MFVDKCVSIFQKDRFLTVGCFDRGDECSDFLPTPLCDTPSQEGRVSFVLSYSNFPFNRGDRSASDLIWSSDLIVSIDDVNSRSIKRERAGISWRKTRSVRKRNCIEVRVAIRSSPPIHARSYAHLRRKLSPVDDRILKTRRVEYISSLRFGRKTVSFIAAFPRTILRECNNEGIAAWSIASEFSWKIYESLRRNKSDRICGLTFAREQRPLNLRTRATVGADG